MAQRERERDGISRALRPTQRNAAVGGARRFDDVSARAGRIRGDGGNRVSRGAARRRVVHPTLPSRLSLSLPARLPPPSLLPLRPAAARFRRIPRMHSRARGPGARARARARQSPDKSTLASLARINPLAAAYRSTARGTCARALRVARASARAGIPISRPE